MKKNLKSIRPFLSILILTGTLFLVVFAKMEKVRLSYEIFKISKELIRIKDEHSFKLIDYAKVTRLDRVRYLAQTQFTMVEAKKGQIIQLAGDKIALSK